MRINQPYRFTPYDANLCRQEEGEHDLRTLMIRKEAERQVLLREEVIFEILEGLSDPQSILGKKLSGSYFALFGDTESLSDDCDALERLSRALRAIQKDPEAF